MPRVPSRHSVKFCRRSLRAKPVGVSPQESRAIDFAKVSEPRLLIIVGPLRIVSAAVLYIATPGLYAILITFANGVLRIVENVMSVTAVVVEIGIVSRTPTPGPIKRPVDWTAHDDYSALSFNRAARKQ